MKKDFVGKGRTVPGAENSDGGRVDSALPVNLAVQGQLCDKSSSMQPFMPLSDPVSYAAIQTISTSDTNIKACAVQQDPQIAFGMKWNNVQQVPIPAPVSQASSLVTMNCPLLKVHGMSNAPNLSVTPIKSHPFLSLLANNNSLLGDGVGSFSPRKVLKPSPTTRQLTIFYAGSVNVYDDVPWDKAQAIMLMASEGCKTAANVVRSIGEAPALPLTKESNSNHLTVAQASNLVNNHAMSSCPDLSSTLSLSSHQRNQSWSSSVAADDSAGLKRIGTTVLTGSDDTSKTMSTFIVPATAATILSRAVPQARKASLARFLEKRKERVSNTAPYPFDKRSSEKPVAPDFTSTPSNFSTAWGYCTYSQDILQFKGQANDCDDNSNSPSTN